MTAVEPPKKKLLERVREAIRLKHYSYRTEETYVQWIKRYIFFHNTRHPQEADAIALRFPQRALHQAWVL